MSYGTTLADRGHATRRAQAPETRVNPPTPECGGRLPRLSEIDEPRMKHGSNTDQKKTGFPLGHPCFIHVSSVAEFDGSGGAEAAVSGWDDDKLVLDNLAFIPFPRFSPPCKGGVGGMVVRYQSACLPTLPPSKLFRLSLARPFRCPRLPPSPPLPPLCKVGKEIGRSRIRSMLRNTNKRHQIVPPVPSTPTFHQPRVRKGRSVSNLSPGRAARVGGPVLCGASDPRDLDRGDDQVEVRGDRRRHADPPGDQLRVREEALGPG